ncbi:hypothetical protein Tco_0663552 [Tanacetum coccineum]
MHERPTGKICVYTRFFEFANFWLPLSTFLVDVLSIEPTVGLFRCFYVNSKNKGWMSFSKRSDNPLPKSTEFNMDDYVVLVAHPAPFRKFPEPFLCLVGMSHYYTLDENTYPRFLHDNGEEMDLFAFIHVVDPTKVKVVGRERTEGEAKLLDSTVGRVVPILPVAPAHAESDLEASVDKLFDEGGSMDQGDSAVGGGHDAEIELVTAVEDIIVGNVTAKRPKRPRKKRLVVTDSSGSSHPPKKLRGDHETSSGVATGGKSPSVLKELLASNILNVEGGDPTDSITRPNLRTIGPTKRFVISSDSSHHSSTNAFEAEVESFIRLVVPPPVMTEAV